MKSIIMWGAFFVFGLFQTHGQSLFERFPNKPEKQTALLLAYTGNLNVCALGSGTLYMVPMNASNQGAYVCLVTAFHMLHDPKTLAPYDGILAKINMPAGSKPRYIKIPLKNDAPRNYWTSPSGYDLAVIPLPPHTIDGADFATSAEGDIVTPSNSIAFDISPGLITQMLCVQFEYLDHSDFLKPQTFPSMRMGHLARLGFYEEPDGTFAIRPHIIDVHSSPGNSGAAVLINVPSKDFLTSRSLFLGIVQGFNEEAGGYTPYDAPLKTQGTSITLVSAQTGITNQVAVAIKTIANPNLTFVTPVYELVGLRDSKEFQTALLQLLLNINKYEVLEGLPH